MLETTSPSGEPARASSSCLSSQPTRTCSPSLIPRLWLYRSLLHQVFISVYSQTNWENFGKQVKCQAFTSFWIFAHNCTASLSLYWQTNVASECAGRSLHTPTLLQCSPSPQICRFWMRSSLTCSCNRWGFSLRLPNGQYGFGLTSSWQCFDCAFPFSVQTENYWKQCPCGLQSFQNLEGKTSLKNKQTNKKKLYVD